MQKLEIELEETRKALMNNEVRSFLFNMLKTRIGNQSLSSDFLNGWNEAVCYLLKLNNYE